MDGTLAVLFIVASLGDMITNDCPTNCVQQSPAAARLNVQAADLIYQQRSIGHEAYVSFDAPVSYGPFQPMIGVSATSIGDLWIGFGAKWTTEDLIDGPFFIEASLLPGLYIADDGPDIGGTTQFRSAFGVGYTFKNGDTVSVHFDHRSNADTQNTNPGLETLGLRYAVAFE